MVRMTTQSGSDASNFQTEAGRLRDIASRLKDVYGARVWHAHAPPLDELIATVLSQHTSDINTARAFSSLRQAFPTWDRLLDARPDDLAAAIRSGGLAKVKAPRIQAVLREIEAESGALSLDWLARLPTDDARAWLMSLPGVGPKTASCVLLFSLGRPTMPVDTHVYRVSRRLGVIDERVPAASAHEPLERAIGPDRDAVYALHLNLIAHGRAVCRARNPACGRCVLADLCPSAPIFAAKPASPNDRPCVSTKPFDGSR
jgi:endonuclease III